MSKKQEKMRHAILDVDSREIIGEITFTILDDGLNNTVFFPQLNHTITLKEEIYVVKHIHHDYEMKVIFYGVKKILKE